MSVFHLKYRPSKITELDLPEVSDKIKSIILSKNEFQSLLFAGPKGSGKTSAARILAKAVNCTKLKDSEACGKCDNCLEIEKGNSLDIIEIDAASNRGIDDVRGLKENAYLSPIRLKKKVFIIDEVHMLTKEAFNALLKLIEEPPKDTLFILCTTDAQKIPETVLSRLLKVNFRKGKENELEKCLEKIVKGENIEIEEAGRKLLIQNSDGSFRNLQRTFNEICLQFGNKISEEQVKTFFVAM
ncbi:MAG: DNA polymerase III subunit gamma/tau, partial [Candidatus Shapirobacteria bacterium]